MNRILISLLILMLYSCTASPRYNSSTDKKVTNNNTKKSSNTKKSTVNRNKKEYKGISSWYGKDFHGNLTANGEVYDMYGITAAHKEFPLNTWARVTNLDNDKSIILRINDRGPYVGERILDCSYGAAKKLDFLDKGTANVKINIIEWGDGEYMHHE
ncbi:MAG: hypothetical protein CMD65_00265 [Gammaproteobacteria bacterium]|nr:hypothetical protein [Gammaproteobacteria bacterium]